MKAENVEARDLGARIGVIAVFKRPHVLPRAVFFDLFHARAANLTQTVKIHQQRFSRAYQNVLGRL